MMAYHCALCRPDGPFAELLPWAAEQVADWEAAASAGASLPDVSLAQP